MTVDLYIATERPLPEPDPDELLLLATLESAGIRAQMAAWDDPSVQWMNARATVIRSTWSYYLAPDAFLAWAEHVASVSVLWNPLPVIRDNVHKRYLLTLQKQGLPVVPTMYFEAGADVDIVQECIEYGWESFVAKPAVSAASWQTYAMTTETADAAVLRGLLQRHDTLVQPFVNSVRQSGERSLVFIDGEFTHAMQKNPRFAGQEESVTGPHPVRPADLKVALAALSTVSEPLLYGRVDLMDDDHGSPMVSEMELIEPSLFLLQHPPALERLVTAVRRRLS